MNDTAVSARRPQRLTMLLLLVVFCAPFALSWYLFNFTQVGRTGSSHGHLIVPPRPLAEVKLQGMDGTATDAVLRGKWSLIRLLPAACTQHCLDALYQMRQLRLAMGRNGVRIQRVMVVYGSFPPTFPEQVVRDYPGQLLVAGAELDGNEPGRAFRLHDGDNPAEADRLYVVDPMGNLMLAHPSGTKPEDIIDDLNRLLRYSGSG